MIYNPHGYQKFATQKIEELPACALFLAMGLGKTVCTLTAVNDLMYDSFKVSKVLVIAPKRVALDTWTTESKKWDHLKHLEISRVLGSRGERITALEKDADIYVTNREQVTWLVDYLRKQWPFDMIVIDESSSFKSNTSKRFKSLRIVRPLVDRIVLLTGTPAPNGLMDLWPQLYLLDMGQRLGKTITGFRNRYFVPAKFDGHIVYQWEPKRGADDAIHKKIDDICISMKAEDYLKLPERIVNDISIALDDKEMALYRKLERERVLKLDEETITAATAAAVYNKLLQMANGAIYDEYGDYINIHDKKISALGEIIENACGHPVLVFYDFRSDYDRLLKVYPKARTLNSQKDIQDWNAGKIPLLLAQPASMGHGLNIQAGGHICVWFGLNWSLELYQQANARLHRQGQQHTVIVHRLITQGTVDEQVIKRLESKDDRQESLMEAVKARIREVKENDIELRL